MRVETLWNEVLDLIGYKKHVGFSYEGTPAARVLLDIYSQTRDELLLSLKPDWAMGDVILEQTHSAPDVFLEAWDPATQPAIGYRFEYAYPVNTLEILGVKSGHPRFAVEYRPRPAIWAYDLRDGKRVIVTDIEYAVASVILRVTDPDEWSLTFRAMLVQLLAKKAASLVPGTARKEEKPKDADTA